MRHLTVDQYHEMIETGTLTESDDLELLEGWLVAKTRRTPLHDATIQIVDEALGAHLPGGWDIRIGCGLTTGDSETEPDIALVRGTARSYFKRHPGPHDTGLLVEVAERSSIDCDCIEKKRIYARAGIAVYWIINLVDMQIDVYTDPTGPDAAPHYRQRQIYGIPQSVPLVLDGHTMQVPVCDLLP